MHAHVADRTAAWSIAAAKDDPGETSMVRTVIGWEMLEMGVAHVLPHIRER